MEDVIDVDELGRTAFLNKLRSLAGRSIVTIYGTSPDGDDYFYPHPLYVVAAEDHRVKVRTFDRRQYFIELPGPNAESEPAFTWRGRINGGIDPMCHVDRVEVHETNANQNDIRVAALDKLYTRAGVADGE